MPRLIEANPKYRRHKQSGRGRVRVDGRDILLPGKYGSKESRDAYDRVVSEWIAHGRMFPPDPDQPITVAEVTNAYRKHARGYYLKDGTTTSEYHLTKSALSHVRQYDKTAAVEFGPKCLEAVRNSMIDAGWARRSINRHIDRIRRMFKWAVAEEMIPVSVHQTLRTLAGLRRGRTVARESEGVAPVPDTTIQHTLHHLPAVVADMLLFERRTGCRPGEVCSLTPAQVDRTGDVWIYRLASHKTEHHGKERVVRIGPKAQEILRPYLLRDSDDCCFSPRDSEKKRRREQHANRKTPLEYGNRPGTNCTRKPRRTPGSYYTVSSYRRAIHRGCDKAFPPPAPLARRADETRTKWEARLTDSDWETLAQWQADHRWSPNQLRHTFATEVRRAAGRDGLEAARILLGHADSDTTELYAERDMELADRVARAIG